MRTKKEIINAVWEKGEPRIIKQIEKYRFYIESYTLACINEFEKEIKNTPDIN